MKKTLVMALALVPCFTYIQGQNAGQIIASQYGEFKVTGSTSGGFSFPPATCQVSAGGRNFAAFSTGTPIKIVDSNPNLTEVATPSSVYIGANQALYGTSSNAADSVLGDETQAAKTPSFWDEVGNSVAGNLGKVGKL